MTREELKALGLTDEQVESVMASYGKTVNAVKGERDNLTIERDDLKTQLTDRDTQLNDLSGKVEDNEELTKTIEQMKSGNEEKVSELQQKLDKQAFDHALEKAIVATGARNPKAVIGLLDTEKVKLDGEKLLGLDTQIEALKTSDDYLFGTTETPTLGGRTPNQPPAQNPTIKNPFSDEHFNFTEQGKLLSTDPELYKQLKEQAGK